MPKPVVGMLFRPLLFVLAVTYNVELFSATSIRMIANEKCDLVWSV